MRSISVKQLIDKQWTHFKHLELSLNKCLAHRLVLVVKLFQLRPRHQQKLFTQKTDLILNAIHSEPVFHFETEGRRRRNGRAPRELEQIDHILLEVGFVYGGLGRRRLFLRAGSLSVWLLLRLLFGSGLVVLGGGRHGLLGGRGLVGRLIGGGVGRLGGRCHCGLTARQVDQWWLWRWLPAVADWRWLGWSARYGCSPMGPMCVDVNVDVDVGLSADHWNRVREWAAIVWYGMKWRHNSQHRRWVKHRFEVHFNGYTLYIVSLWLGPTVEQCSDSERSHVSLWQQRGLTQGSTTRLPRQRSVQTRDGTPQTGYNTNAALAMALAMALSLAVLDWAVTELWLSCHSTALPLYGWLQCSPIMRWTLPTSQRWFQCRFSAASELFECRAKRGLNGEQW